MQQMQTQQQNTAVNTNVAPTKPGMNPPHGQPGHRCDIAVGAPLNSKATQMTTTPAPTAGSAITQQVSIPSTPNQNDAATPTILNPDATNVVTEPE